MAFPPGFEPIDDELPKGFTLIESAPKLAAPQRDWLDDRRQSMRDAALGGVDDAGVPQRQLSNREQWFETKIRPLLETAAHPQSGAEVAPLLIPSATAIGEALAPVARGAANVARKIPFPTGAQALRAYKFARHPLRESGKAALDFIIERLERPAVSAASRSVPEAAEAVAPRVMESIADPKAIADRLAIRAASAANPSDLYAASREAFKAANIEPLKAEIANVFELIRRGKAPEEAVRIIVGARPKATLTAAEQLAQRLGTPSNATVAQRVTSRNATGLWEP